MCTFVSDLPNIFVLIIIVESEQCKQVAQPAAAVRARVQYFSLGAAMMFNRYFNLDHVATKKDGALSGRWGAHCARSNTYNSLPIKQGTQIVYSY